MYKWNKTFWDFFFFFTIIGNNKLQCGNSTYTLCCWLVAYNSMPSSVSFLEHWSGFCIWLCSYKMGYSQRQKSQAVFLPSDSATWCVMKGLLKWPSFPIRKCCWLILYLSVPVRFKVLSNNHLQIRGIKKSDEGDYTCEGRIMARGEIDLRVIMVIVNGEKSIQMHGN